MAETTKKQNKPMHKPELAPRGPPTPTRPSDQKTNKRPKRGDNCRTLKANGGLRRRHTVFDHPRQLSRSTPVGPTRIGPRALRAHPKAPKYSHVLNRTSLVMEFPPPRPGRNRPKPVDILTKTAIRSLPGCSCLFLGILGHIYVHLWASAYPCDTLERTDDRDPIRPIW